MKNEIITNFKKFYIYTFLCAHFSTKKDKVVKKLKPQAKKIPVEKATGSVKDKVKDKANRKFKSEQEQTAKENNDSFVATKEDIGAIHSRMDFLHSVIMKLVVEVSEHKRMFSDLKSLQKPFNSEKVIVVKKAKEKKSQTISNLKKK